MHNDIHLESYLQAFDALTHFSPFELAEDAKQQALINCVSALDKHHQEHCVQYANIAQNFETNVESILTMPYLAVRLFKLLSLKSIDEESIFRVLQSSGTTSQRPANIYLDANTSRRQSKVLVKILQSFLGKQRLPTLVIDAPSTLKSKGQFSARSAGIQGISLFSRNMHFALNDDMTLNLSALEAFCEQTAGQPSIVFGFTFMVWQHWIQALKKRQIKLNLQHAILLHSGGWKKLIDQAVDNIEFKQQVQSTTQIQRVHNFYGMAEQVGSIFVECEAGHLHTPVYSDVIIRDMNTFDVLPVGKSGLIQVVSSIPSSYPGHSLLTEDLGKVLGVDNCSCGRKGKYFEVLGRLPRTEVRGCSDTA